MLKSDLSGKSGSAIKNETKIPDPHKCPYITLRGSTSLRNVIIVHTPTFTFDNAIYLYGFALLDTENNT